MKLSLPAPFMLSTAHVMDLYTPTVVTDMEQARQVLATTGILAVPSADLDTRHLVDCPLPQTLITNEHTRSTWAGHDDEAEWDCPSADALRSESLEIAQALANHDSHYLEHVHVYDHIQSIHMDWHVDQGDFIVMAPAQYVDDDDALTEFRIRLENQIYTLDMPAHHWLILAGDTHAHPVAHQVHVAATAARRVWYGLMVQSSSKPDCTTPSRSLEATACEDDELWCWNRCMSHNITVCDNVAHDLSCVNPAGELWPEGLHDATFAPGCADTSTDVTADADAEPNHGNNATEHSNGDDDDDHEHADGDDDHSGHGHGEGEEHSEKETDTAETTSAGSKWSMAWWSLLLL